MYIVLNVGGQTSMKIDSYALQPETLLQDKYHILMPIGHGGFSITYLSECLSDGKMVAVKEFFNSLYMERSAPDNYIHIKNDSFYSLYIKEKRRFCDEWNTLKKFSSFPGCVSPISFFEENNTAYIVMEHLSGGSMKDIVRTKGKYNADTISEKISQVLTLLDSMHERGYVHGDISPDNLVMDQEGNYKVIDFGAVRKIGTSANTDELLRKEGYTPVEVFNKRSEADPRSDIYSLCASLYFAMTGQAPEDALERMIMDELRPVSDICPEIDSLISELVMKGISMNPEDRWKNIKEIQDIFKQYKKSADDRKKEAEEKKRRQRNIKITIISIISITVILILTVFCLTHRELLKFKGAETQKFVFYYDKCLDATDIRELEETLRQKATYFIGPKGYILTQSHDYFEITMEYEPLKTVNIPVVLNKYFNFGQCDIGTYSGGLFTSFNCISDSDNIIGIREEDDGFTITPSKELLKEITENTDDNTQIMLRIYTDGGENHVWNYNIPMESNVYDVEINVNKDEGNIFIPDTENEGKVGRKLFIDCLLHNNSLPITSYNYTRHITWESKQDTTWGNYQVDHSQIHGKTVILNYLNDDQYDNRVNILNYTVYEDEMEYDTEVIYLKKRLDALQIPYACGWDTLNSRELYILLKADNIWGIEAEMMFESMTYDDISIKSESGIMIASIYPDVPFSTEDGKIRVKILNTEQYKVNDKWINDHKEKIQLCINNRPIFQTSLNEIPKDGWVSFEEPVLSNLEKNDQNQRILNFTEFVNTMQKQKLSPGHYCFIDAIFMDSGREPIWQKGVWDLQGCEMKDLRNQIFKRAFDYGIKAKWNRYLPSNIEIICYYDETMKEKYRHPFEMASEFLSNIKLTNEVTHIMFQINDNEHYPLRTIYELGVEKNTDYGNLVINWWVYHQLYKKVSDSSSLEAIAQVNQEEAIKYLATDNYYTSSFLYPPLNESLKESSLEDKDYSIKICLSETAPGQDYYFTVYLENKTDEKISISHPLVSINNTIVGNGESYYADSELEPHSDCCYSLQYSEKDLHFSTMELFQNMIAEFKISYEDQEIYRKLEISDSANSPKDNNRLIPSNVELIDKTSSYVFYSLGVRQSDHSSDRKEACFLVQNMTDNILIFDFEKMGYDSKWDDFFEPYVLRILPHSVAYQIFDYSDVNLMYIQNLNPKTISLNIKVMSDDYSGKIKNISLDNYSVDIRYED